MACLSLRGFPFLSGFYSKDLVLEAFLNGGFGLVLGFIVIISTCLTAVYRGCILYKVLFSSMDIGFIRSMVSSVYVRIPCGILGFGALFGGFIMQSIIIRFNRVFRLYSVMKGNSNYVCNEWC